MATWIRARLTYANVVSTLCLFILLGGGAYAATKLPRNSVGPKQLKRNAVTGSKVKNRSLSGADLKLSSIGRVPSADSATSATTASDAANLGGSPAAAFQKFGTTLPSGQTMSGDYGLRAGTVNFLATSVSFPVPLAAALSVANVVYTTAASATHCPGVGQAERGFLCIYEGQSTGVTNPPDVASFEGVAGTPGSGRFGFNMEWAAPGASAFALGTWSVTAP